MSQRQIHFHVEELARVATQAVEAEHYVSISKCPDGMFNKALILTMDDGREIIAKLPNPNAGRAHFTTASEIATMDFVSSILTLHMLEYETYLITRCAMYNTTLCLRCMRKVPMRRITAWVQNTSSWKSSQE